MKKFKYFFAAIGGLAATYLKAYVPLIIIVTIAVIFDFITGILSAVIVGDGLDSKTARKGVWKKGMLFLALGFGIFLDYMIPMAAAQVGFTITTKLLFSSIIGFYIAFTECVSVAENILECCPGAFPQWVLKILKEGKEQIDKKGEGES